MNLDFIKSELPVRWNFSTANIRNNLVNAMPAINSVPLANLRSSMQQTRNFFDGKQGSYDALALALSNVPEQYDAAFDAKFDFISSASAYTSDFVSVEREVGEQFIAGLIESFSIQEQIRLSGEGLTDAEIKDYFSDLQTCEYAITDANGYVYDLRINLAKCEKYLQHQQITGELVSCLTYEGSKTFMFISNSHVTYMSVKMYQRRYASQLNVSDSIKEMIVDMFLDSNKSVSQSVITELLIPSMSILNALHWGIQFFFEDPDAAYAYDTIDEYIDYCYEHVLGEQPVSGMTISEKLSQIRDHQVSTLNKLVRKAKDFISFASDIVKTSEINATLSDLCAVVLDSKPGEALTSLATRASDRTKVVRSVIHHAMDAFRQGGIRGLYKYIINYIRGGSSIFGDDGKIKFTNNSTFIPKEFIGGILGSVVSTLSQIVLMVASLFRSVLLIAVSIVGVIVGSIMNSVKSTHDDVRASIISNDNYDGDLSILNYMPMAFGRLTVNRTSKLEKLFDTFDCAYQSCGVPFELPVPGGALFVGPLEINDETSEVITYGAEFHPANILFEAKPGFYLSDLIADAELDANVFKMGVLHPYYLHYGNGHFTFDLWNEVLKNPGKAYKIPINDTSGHLSNGDDALVQGSILTNIGFFLLWMMESMNAFRLVDDPDTIFNTVTVSDWESQYSCAYCVLLLQTLYTVGSVAVIDSWTDITSFLSFMDTQSFVYCGTLSDNTVIQFNTALDVTPQGWQPMQDLAYGRVKYTVYPLPSQVQFSLQPPTYNSKTYWSWVLLVGAILAVGAAAVAVVSVAFTKFAKKKRADNKARFDDKQSTYNEALQGLKSEIDADGHVKYTQFDPNSSEGKDYIKQCWKDYKKTAFKNNLWANIIGGSRYDVSTFWGEKESSEEEDSSNEASLDGYVATQLSSDDLESVDDSASLTPLDSVTYEYAKANSTPSILTNRQLLSDIVTEIQRVRSDVSSGVITLDNAIDAVAGDVVSLRSMIRLLITGTSD